MGRSETMVPKIWVTDPFEQWEECVRSFSPSTGTGLAVSVIKNVIHTCMYKVI